MWFFIVNNDFEVLVAQKHNFRIMIIGWLFVKNICIPCCHFLWSVYVIIVGIIGFIVLLILYVTGFLIWRFDEKNHPTIGSMRRWKLSPQLWVWLRFAPCLTPILGDLLSNEPPTQNTIRLMKYCRRIR